MIRRSGVLIAALLLTGLCALALGQRLSFEEQDAVRDSLSRVHPRLRSRWLGERGIRLPGENAPLPPTSDSAGLRLVGKFGRGPAFEVTGRDSLAFLCLGSEVAVLRLADTGLPVVVSEIQANGLVRKAALRDSFLYFSAMWGGSPGVDIWNIQNPSAPVQRGHIPTLLQDFCVRDTFLYVTQALDGVADTFKVYSVADPEQPYLLGSCRDSGDAVTVTNGAAFLADRWGLYVVDVTDPRNPHRIGSYGGMPISVEARNTICCVTFGNPNQPDWLEFDILDVSNPSLPRRLGYLSNTGGYDIFLEDSFAYLSGYYTGGHDFKILSIADSSRPRLVGTCVAPGIGLGVWVSSTLRRAFLAEDRRGVALVDVSAPAAPIYDTSVLKTGSSQDISVDGAIACVASQGVGMVILDVSNPAVPVQLGVLDSTKVMNTRAVLVRGSFAFMEFSPSWLELRSVDVSDPAHPTTAGGVLPFNPAMALALRDSFLFVGEDSKFEVYNVARPRQPVLVGSCNGDGAAIVVQDSLAYTAAGATRITNVARPSSPVVVATITGHGASGVAVRDTLLYIPAGYDTVWVYSVADPVRPYLVGYTPMLCHLWDISLADSLAAVATVRGLDIISLADPARPQRLGGVTTPYGPRRVVWAAPYFYTAMWEAGVAIYGVESVGLAERPEENASSLALSVYPNPASGQCRVALGAQSASEMGVRDVVGRTVLVQRIATRPVGGLRLDVSKLAPGVYFLEVKANRKTSRMKLVKQ